MSDDAQNKVGRLEAEILKAIRAYVDECLSQTCPERGGGDYDDLRRLLQEKDQQLFRLQRTHQLLQEEMARSHEMFERKRQEWRMIKQVLSKRQRLEELLCSLEGATQTRPSQHVTCSVCTDDLLPSSIAQVPPANPPTEIESSTPPILDPLVLLAEEASDSPKPATSNEVLFIESTRCKSKRRQLHATDCPCCERVRVRW